jgi:iron complex transport system ATP-binding protein
MKTSTSEFAIEARSLECGYRGRRVLSAVNLHVEPGVVMGILGPNGAGKSTLLRTLSGELPSLGGETYLLGQQLSLLSPKDRASAVAYVPQEEPTDFGFTALEMAAMGRIACSNGLFESDEDLAVAREALAEVDAGHLSRRIYRQLSGGEKQRVLIARALAQKASILLLDEPSAHLDLAHQGLLIRVLRTFAERGGAVLIAVHDLNLAGVLADHAVLLHDGTVSTSASIRDVLESDHLDVVYGNRLQRITVGADRILIVPSLTEG